VQTFAGRHDLWNPDSRVIAAVSGGSDSVALLLILRALAAEGHLRLAGVAHVHHHIRGRSADDDYAFVQALALRLGLPCDIGHADVPAMARQAGRSLEVAGRNVRLDFYRQALGRLGAQSIALAHTRGDQAETVLLRLARGAGPRGLGSMAPRSGHRIRPLLEVSRHELRAWLVAQGEPWREDATNSDVAVVRNRIRHHVLPQLAFVNPRVEEALARAARIHTADADVLDELAGAEVERLVHHGQGGVTIEAGGLHQLPEALARRVVLRALHAAEPSKAYSWNDTDGVLRLTTGGPLDIGRVRVELNGRFVVLTVRATSPKSGGTASPRAGATTHADGPVVVLEVPGRVRHPSGWWILEADGPMAPEATAPSSANQVVLDAAALGRHLTIRGWRPGDRVQPLGLGGRKKLQDVFVDRKVPRDERSLVPVVLDARERIAWVAGHVVGEPFRVTSSSASVVVLTLRR
jgi:tRNA(Ile)-lysidine synthase